MVQIGTIGRAAPARPTAGAAAGRAPAARALVVRDGDAPGSAERGSARPAQTQEARGGTRPLAGFLTQLILDADPSLRPSRLERTRLAAGRYAETARLTA